MDRFMREAIGEAEATQAEGGFPFGAVLVRQDRIDESWRQHEGPLGPADDRDGSLRAVSQARTEAVAVDVADEACLAVDDGESTLRARRHTISATVTQLLVDLDDHDFNFFTNRHYARRVDVLVGPVHLGDVHQAFDAFLDLYEAAVVGNVRDLAEDPRYGDKLAEMEALLLAEMRRLDDPYRLWNQPDDGLTPPVTRSPSERRETNRK